MLDPELIGVITAAVTATAAGIGTEAGRQAWESLGRLVRRDTSGAGSVERWTAVPTCRDEVVMLVQRLCELAAGHPTFAADLAEWARAANFLPGSVPATVINEVSGGARVGTVIQAHTVNGSISLAPDPRQHADS
ncbi:hypothetical protein O7628_04795 [Micromonospora sp. WMMD956]|uniref:hypothetical protein n=1 Tax=Micromonospora sp. WMMD956 TaxID=3016108 RepID=UPI0024171F6B|nr:hypothetical protein [Micromonospora sp. WMMD956]MDG4814829.1 hypothetical protein [Micromonospora sp. WMMD956]